MEQIYLDHAATTPIHPAVVQAMTRSLTNIYGNPSSVHSFGRTARQVLDEARKTIADSLAANEQEIVFTGSGTESDNLAILGTAYSRQNIGRHIITSEVEHPGVRKPMAYLAEHGFDITYLKVNEQGQIDLAELAAALTEQTILVSLMTVNNETGVIFPIQEISELLSDYPAYFHTDAVQAYGLMDLNVQELGVDLLSAAGHKINGPKGTGFLFIKDGVHLEKICFGGSQEDNRRPGTENIAGICGFAKAAQLRPAFRRLELRNIYQKYAQMLLNMLTTANIDYEVNGSSANRSFHVLNIRFIGVRADVLLKRLDLAGFAVSSGSACTAGDIAPSVVLQAMYGKEHPALSESLRISFGLGNSEKQIQLFGQQLIDSVRTMTEAK